MGFVFLSLKILSRNLSQCKKGKKRNFLLFSLGNARHFCSPVLQLHWQESCTLPLSDLALWQIGKWHRKLLYSGAGPAMSAKLGVALLCKRCLLISLKQAMVPFPVGCTEGASCLGAWPEDFFLLRSLYITFMLSESKPTLHPKPWTEHKLSTSSLAEHQPPYIVAVLPRYVEIRTLEPRLLVQSIELQRPRFITSGG